MTPEDATAGRCRRHLRLVTFLVPLWLVVYFAVGYSRIRTTDIVPFSAWALFVFVPNQPSVYTLTFHMLDGAPLEPPVSLESGELADPHSITSSYLINHFGRALESGDTAAARGYQRLIEANILPRNRAVGWELVNLSYDPLERWATGKTETRTVARFEYNPKSRRVP
jgi:hypothetical protein